MGCELRRRVDATDHPDLRPGNRKAVLSALSDCAAEETGKGAFPSIARLARTISKSPKTVERCLRDLAALKWITRAGSRGQLVVWDLVTTRLAACQQTIPWRRKTDLTVRLTGAKLAANPRQSVPDPRQSVRAIRNDPSEDRSLSKETPPKPRRDFHEHRNRPWWKPKPRAAPEVLHHNAADDWYEECGRLHNHECELSRWRHFERKATDAFRLQYQRGETSAGLAACPG